MLTAGLLERLRSLKLHGMARALEDLDATRPGAELSFEDRLTLMIDHEETERASRALRRRMQVAKLRCPEASVEEVDMRRRKGLSRSALMALARCEWIRAGHNVLLTGKTGVGKTWLACALGNQACRQGLSVRYLRLPTLLEQLRIAHGDGSYVRLMGQLLKTDLLILDDWGIQPLTRPQRNDLMEVIEDRHDRRSTLIASQLPIENWHDFIGEPTASDAICDRILHAAHRIVLRGPSKRPEMAKNGRSKN